MSVIVRPHLQTLPPCAYLRSCLCHKFTFYAGPLTETVTTAGLNVAANEAAAGAGEQLKLDFL